MFRAKADEPPAETVDEPAAAEPTEHTCNCSHAAKDVTLPRIFREGRSFAERKAMRTAEARPSGPRLVSLGPTEYAQRTKDGDLEVLDCELLFDYDHPTDYYVRFPGRTHLIRLNDADRRRDRVTELPPLKRGQRRLSKPESGSAPSPPTRVTPIDTPNPLFT